MAGASAVPAADDLRSLRNELDKLKEERSAAERRLRDLNATNRRADRPVVPPPPPPPPGAAASSSRNERKRKRPGSPPPREGDRQQAPKRGMRRPPEPSRPGAQRAYESDFVRARSKRMFGALMGHLGRAKSTLESDDTVAKQQNKQREATEKLEAEQNSRRQTQSLEWKVEHGAAVDERDRISTEIRIAEKKLQHAAWIKSRGQLSRFILTKTQPRLSWLPNRHTDETRKLLDQSRDAERAEVASRAALNDQDIRHLRAGLQGRRVKRKEATELTNAKLEELRRNSSSEADAQKQQLPLQDDPDHHNNNNNIEPGVLHPEEKETEEKKETSSSPPHTADEDVGRKG